MTGIRVVDAASAASAVLAFRDMGIDDIVITMGSNGVAVAPKGESSVVIPARKVTPVDTTGAGDSFMGAMAYFISQGDDLRTACSKPNIVASISVTRKGTQSSYPDRTEVLSALENSTVAQHTHSKL